MVAKNHSIFSSDRFNGGRLVQNTNAHTIYHYSCTKIDDAGGTVDDDVKQDQETKSHLWCTHIKERTHINTQKRQN